jgi:dihydrofolate reductase
MNSIPKIAFSKKGFDASGIAGASKAWTESQVLTGDLAEEVAELKRQPGKILVAHGGTSFVQSLVHTGLIDEFWFAIHPVVLGHGFHLFSELKSPLDLKLESTASFEAGTLANVYRVD